MNDKLLERDIVVTKTDDKGGKRVLVDAFLIATVEECKDFSYINFRQSIAGESFIKVKESFDEVVSMKRRAMGLGMNENCM